MSYDVYINCGKCGHSSFERNYTSNMAPAWRAAGADVASFSGKRAAECIDELAAAIARIDADREAFRKYEPDNGWGSVDRMLDNFLIPLLAAMRANPDGVVDVSR